MKMHRSSNVWPQLSSDRCPKSLNSIFDPTPMNPQRNHLAFLLVLVATVLTDSLGSASRTAGGTCETLPSSVHVTKEEYVEGGILDRSCEGDVAVSKCEGSCTSQVQPSVVHPSGFLKECMCCRETFLRERIVTLTLCYDHAGNRLSGKRGSMDIKLREPAECKCSRCGESD